jgi:hypothetical protein
VPSLIWLSNDTMQLASSWTSPEQWSNVTMKFNSVLILLTKFHSLHRWLTKHQRWLPQSNSSTVSSKICHSRWQMKCVVIQRVLHLHWPKSQLFNWFIHLFSLFCLFYCIFCSVILKRLNLFVITISLLCRINSSALMCTAKQSCVYSDMITCSLRERKRKLPRACDGRAVLK